MGGNNSRPSRSTSKDTTKNLTWALDEQMRWSDQAYSAKSALVPHDVIREPHRGEIGAQFEELHRRAERTSHQIDDIISGTDALYIGKKGETIVGAKEAAKATTVLGHHTGGHANVASSTFAAAATQSIAVDSQPSNTIISGAGPSTGVQSEVTVNPTIGDLSQAAATPAVSTNASETYSAQQLPNVDSYKVFEAQINQQAQQTKVEIAAKYLFIHSLLQKLVKLAENAYQLSSKQDYLHRRLKPKRTHNLTQSEIDRINTEQRDGDVLLSQALENFDRARDTLSWLYRDYQLSFAQYKLNDAIINTHHYRHSLLQMTHSNQVVAGVTASDALGKVHQDNEKRIKELDSVLYRLSEKNSKIDVAMQANEKEALTIGLSFLDDNFSGALEESDAANANLSQRVFDVIDNKNHKITKANLLSTLDRLSSAISHRRHDLDKLTKENSHYKNDNKHIDKYNSNREKIESLRRDNEIDRSNLRDIYRLFHSAFARHVFHIAEGQIQQQNIDVNRLFDEINEANDAWMDLEPVVGDKEFTTEQAQVQRGNDYAPSTSDVTHSRQTIPQQTTTTQSSGVHSSNQGVIGAYNPVTGQSAPAVSVAAAQATATPVTGPIYGYTVSDPYASQAVSTTAASATTSTGSATSKQHHTAEVSKAQVSQGPVTGAEWTVPVDKRGQLHPEDPELVHQSHVGEHIYHENDKTGLEGKLPHAQNAHSSSTSTSSTSGSSTGYTGTTPNPTNSSQAPIGQQQQSVLSQAGSAVQTGTSNVQWTDVLRPGETTTTTTGFDKDVPTSATNEARRENYQL